MHNPSDLLKTKHREVFIAWRNAKIQPLSLNLRPGNAGVTLICVTRNECWRLPCLLAHYRSLGVKRFVFVDNGSEDDSRDYLAAQADVDLHLCSEAFSTLAQRGWMHQIMQLYGYGKWYLCIDADELLVYDGMEEHSLDDLAALALAEGNKRVRGVFVDMYGPGTLKDYESLDSCLNVQNYCRFFDGTGYAEKVVSRRITMEGGVRKRMFLDVGYTDSFPEMTKYPLIFLEEEDVFSGAHQMLPEWKNFVSDRVLGIMHYKFSRNDFLKIEDAVQRLQHWNGSIEYKCYATWLKNFPNRSLRDENSVKFNSPEDLVKTGLIRPIRWGSAKGDATVTPALSIAALTSSFHRKRILKLFKKKHRAVNPVNIPALVAKLDQE